MLDPDSAGFFPITCYSYCCYFHLVGLLLVIIDFDSFHELSTKLSL